MVKAGTYPHLPLRSRYGGVAGLRAIEHVLVHHTFSSDSIRWKAVSNAAFEMVEDCAVWSCPIGCCDGRTVMADRRAELPYTRPGAGRGEELDVDKGAMGARLICLCVQLPSSEVTPTSKAP